MLGTSQPARGDDVDLPGDLIAEDLRVRLREQAFAVLSELLEPGTSCALVGFPHHANVGDSAIWLGERALLGRAGVSVVYTCDERHFSARELTDRLPAGTILLHGGGNFGDLYLAQQAFREQVIATFPRHRIIQLPQSVHFGQRANLDRARAVLNAHPNLILCLRDQRSLDRAREAFAARCVLSPDMAFGLEELPAAAEPPRYDVLWHARADRESAGQPLPSLPDRVLVTDWVGRQGADRQWTASMRAAERAYRSAAGNPAARAIASDYLAALQLGRGCRLFLSGRVVITDRLHGHVISVLLGLPHVYLSDRYGKVASFRETWTSGWPGARWAQNPDEALALARDLVAAGSARE